MHDDPADDMSGGYEVSIDRSRNRLYLTLEGVLDEETAEAHVEEMLEMAEELGPGFDMVNDISEFKPMTQGATETIERGKRGLEARGVSAVVRVTGESVVGKMQFERVGDDDEGYHVATAETVEEAEELLDGFREQG